MHALRTHLSVVTTLVTPECYGDLLTVELGIGQRSDPHLAE